MLFGQLGCETIATLLPQVGAHAVENFSSGASIVRPQGTLRGRYPQIADRWRRPAKPQPVVQVVDRKGHFWCNTRFPASQWVEAQAGRWAGPTTGASQRPGARATKRHSEMPVAQVATRDNRPTSQPTSQPRATCRSAPPVQAGRDDEGLQMKRTYQASKVRRARTHGFLVRMKSRGGRAVINARRAKGRKRLAV